MGFIVFVRYLFGIRSPKELPWAQDAWNAIQHGGPLEAYKHNPPEHFSRGPVEGEARQFRNDRISLLYFKSSYVGELRETLDILVTAGKRGGMIVYFINGEALSWHRPAAIGRYEVRDQEKWWYTKILAEVRKMA